jgi:hypothetical protein
LKSAISSWRIEDWITEMISIVKLKEFERLLSVKKGELYILSAN